MIRQALTLILLGVGTAHAAEYREIYLTDGRVLKAEIKGFTPDAVTLGIPQGTMVFKPDLLDKMEPLTQPDYQKQPNWRVAILNFTASEQQDVPQARTAHMLALRAISEVPRVTSGTPSDIPGDIHASVRLALSACRTDLLCAVKQGEAAGIDVVIIGEIRRSGETRELRMTSLWVNAPAARKRASVKLTGTAVDHRAEIYASQHDLLWLEPPKGAETSLPTPTPVASKTPTPVPVSKPTVQPTVRRQPPKPSTPMSEATLRKLAWAPVPGLPQLIRKDAPAFGKSLAVTGIGAVIGVGVAGQATYTKPQFIAASVLSTYTITAIANQIFWPQPPPK